MQKHFEDRSTSELHEYVRIEGFLKLVKKYKQGISKSCWFFPLDIPVNALLSHHSMRAWENCWLVSMTHNQSVNFFKMSDY